MFVGSETHLRDSSGFPGPCPGLTWSLGRMSLAGRTRTVPTEDCLLTGRLGGRGRGMTHPKSGSDSVFSLLCDLGQVIEPL